MLPSTRAVIRSSRSGPCVPSAWPAPSVVAEDAMSVAGPVDMRHPGSIVVEHTDSALTADEREQILESVAAHHDSGC